MRMSSCPYLQQWGIISELQSQNAGAQKKNKNQCLHNVALNKTVGKADLNPPTCLSSLSVCRLFPLPASGGEGSILGAAGSVIGIGSDIGGSIRMPCFFNGIFGHKTTPGKRN